MAWNGYRHFELYFGVSGAGAVMHTLNPRLVRVVAEALQAASKRHALVVVTLLSLSVLAVCGATGVHREPRGGQVHLR